jgi:dTDP-4-amino-4,6-dideoxygalactose transaminase
MRIKAYKMTAKTSIGNLALFGGQPAFDEVLHVGRPNIGNRERFMARVSDMFDRDWLTNNGPFVKEFEYKLAEFLGVRHCIAMCNATIALEIAARALGLAGEVIIPSFTFVATAHSLQWQEIAPVFCDVHPGTHNIDPAKIERLITPRTSGIIGVHVWGRACEIDLLTGLAKKHDLKLLFDAAHAFGCSYNGRMLGGFGDAEVFSFHATKFFNTFEGGAIATDNDELAERIQLMRNFGFSGLDNVIYVGTNGKMSEVSAAMGLTSLESLNDFIKINRCNFLLFKKYLEGIPGIQMLAFDERESNNYQYIVLEIDQSEAGISRDLLLRIIHAENVRARRYFYPGCHRMEPYRSYYPNSGLLLPETDKLAMRVMQMPTGTAVGENEIKRICDLIRFTVRNSREITLRIESAQQVNG